MLWDIVDTIPKPYRKNRLLKNNLQDGRNRFRYSCRHQCMSGRFSLPPDNSILPSHTAGQQQVFQRPPSVFPIKFKGKIKDTQGILKLPFLKILFAFLNQRIDIRIFCRSHHFHYALPMFINIQVPLLFKWNLRVNMPLFKIFPWRKTTKGYTLKESASGRMNITKTRFKR